MEKKQLGKGHSLPGDQREEQVRTQKESNGERDTHQLETVEGGTSQNMEGR